MSKTLRIRIFSFVLAAVLSFFGTAYSISIIASAADTVKTWNDWDEVGEDAIALKDAYVKYLREVGEGDFIGALGKGVDVPIKWLKLLSDGRLVLSPCDDIIYFLNDGVLQSTRKQGKEADTGLASRLKPVIDGNTGKQLNNYYSDRWNIDFPDFITNITTSIETAITNVFVADVDVINNYNSELQDTFNKKLPFVNDFGDIFKSLFVDIVDNNFVYAGDIKPSYSSPGSEPDSGGTAEASGSSGSVREESIIYPKWTIDLSFFGKEMELTILDFSMYAEPLSYVRLIVCVFIYAVYFVNLMKYLPTLIGGVIDMGTGVYSTVNPPKKEKGGD